LELLVAQIDEGLIELPAHLQVDALGDANRARSGERFQAGRDVDGVTHRLTHQRPLAYQDVAEVHADAHLQALTRELLLGHASLNGERGMDRGDDTIEAREDRVASAGLGVPLGLTYDLANDAL